MTEIGKKANALVNDVRVERILYPISENFSRKSSEIEALCRLIEQHEALLAENARLHNRLRNIRALATRHLYERGPNGTLADIELFATAALQETGQ